MSADRQYKVAVCGATGAVGREMLRILEERCFPVSELVLLASERSAGERITYCDQDLLVAALGAHSFRGVDLALFSAGGEVSRKFAPVAAESGCIVIDNTSAFRMDPEVPLVVPEVNPDAVAGYQRRGIIANPNCSTIQMVVVLKPIEDAARIRRVVVSTYQSVSGAGQKGIRELEQQCLGVFNLKPIECAQFPVQIAFNCLPQIAGFEPDGYSVEEHKMMNETRKILGRDDLGISATTVRVPVFYCHAEAVNVECERPLPADEARVLLERAPGVRVVDDPDGQRYPTGLDAAGIDDTLVGRIRQDPSRENTLDLWIVADNVRKGAALNAVQIAERLVATYL